MDQAPNYTIPGEFSLWNIVVSGALGFVLGLALFWGPSKLIAYGTKLAKQAISVSGYDSQLGIYGNYATSYLPYAILVFIFGLAVGQLSAVRSLKSFGFFAVSVLIGIIIAFFAKGYLG